MNFLYSNTGNGIVSSLMGSWVFWIVLLLVVVMIFVFVLKSNKSLQQNLRIEHLFTDDNSSTDNNGGGNLKYNTTDYYERENIREHLIHQINEGNRRQRNNDDDSTTINIENYDNDDDDDNDVFRKDRIQLTKHLPVDLNESQIENAKLLGLSGTNKKIKPIYTITGKREEIFKILTQNESIAANNDIVIVDDDGGGGDNTSINNNSSDIKFKLELVNPSKITPESMKAIENNFLNIYNQNGKCIITITFKYRQMIIDSISPFFDKVTINLDENIRLLMFKQIDNKLYLDKDHIAIFGIYDKIKYFAINSSIIKELQYAVK